jgi:hypothetical protein
MPESTTMVGIQLTSSALSSLDEVFLLEGLSHHHLNVQRL